mgnify:CR=1 FL=1
MLVNLAQLSSRLTSFVHTLQVHPVQHDHVIHGVPAVVRVAHAREIEVGGNLR